MTEPAVQANQRRHALSTRRVLSSRDSTSDPTDLSYPSDLWSMNSNALRACWHPVGYSADFGNSPRAATLLDTRVVLWRDASGVLHAGHDRCVHRGTQLSLGRIEGNEIVCPYHGWRFATDGRCTLIPQLADAARTPERARIDMFRCVERYGLAWVALQEPRWPLPEVPELEVGDYRVIRTGPFPWASHASRQLENFTDFGHFAFVHEGLLGNPRQAVVAPHDVAIEGAVVRYAYRRPDEPNTKKLPVFTADTRKDSDRNTRYAIHLPFTIVEHIDWGGRDGMVYFFASQPVSEDRCIGYCLVARNYNHDQPDTVMQEFERVIFGQDQRIIESQQPCAAPLGEGAELHMAFDKVAIAYRKALRDNGFG